jgi:hypothetical protein
LVKHRALAQGDGEKWDFHFLKAGKNLALVWAENGETGVYMTPMYQRLDRKLKRLGEPVKLAELSGAGDNFIADARWTGSGLVLLTAQGDEGEDIIAVNCGEAGHGGVKWDIGDSGSGDSLSRLASGPMGYSAAHFDSDKSLLELVACNYAGGPVAVRDVGQLPAGRLNQLPTASGDGTLLLHWSGGALSLAVIKIGLPVPKLQRVVKSDQSMLFPADGGYLLLYVNKGKLYSAKLNAATAREKGKHLLTKRPLAIASLGYKWATADAAAGAKGFGCVWVETGDKNRVVFRLLDSAGEPIGKRIVLARGNNPSEPRVIFASGHYYAAWFEGDAGQRIYGSKISPK